MWYGNIFFIFCLFASNVHSQEFEQSTRMYQIMHEGQSIEDVKLGADKLEQVTKNEIKLERGRQYYFLIEPQDLTTQTASVLEIDRPILSTLLHYHVDTKNNDVILKHLLDARSQFKTHLSAIDFLENHATILAISSPYNGELRLNWKSEEAFLSDSYKALLLRGTIACFILFSSFAIFAAYYTSNRLSLLALGAYLLSLSLTYTVYAELHYIFLPQALSDWLMDFHGNVLSISLATGALFHGFFLSQRRAAQRYRTWLVAKSTLTLIVAVGSALLMVKLPLALLLGLCVINQALIFYALIKQSPEHKNESLRLTLSWSPLTFMLITMLVTQAGSFSTQHLFQLSTVLLVLHVLALSAFLIWHDRTKRDLIAYYSRHDKATGLPNGTTLQRQLAQLVQEKKPHTLLLFKPLILQKIRLNFGISFTNRQIIKLFKEVQKEISVYGQTTQDKGKNTAVFRLDEYIYGVVLKGKLELSQVEQYVCVLSSIFEEGIEYKETQFVDQLEVGVANYPVHAEQPDTLIQRALQALSIKPNSNQKWQLFDIASSMVSERQLQLSACLKSALYKNQLSLYFQPQVCLSSGKVFGSEALIRWKHPEFGYISPEEFIPLAESSGQIYEITEWVLESALQAQAEFLVHYPEHVISINISGKDLSRKELPVQLITLLNQFSLAPSQVMLEVTESVAIANDMSIRTMLEEYRSIGVKLAIDDFGTGYSSLAYLSELRFDEIKIDKSFVMNIATCQNNQTICKATCDMARSLGAKVVAEGVEELHSYSMLQLYGCDISQGYFISRPLPFQDYLNWLVEITSVDDIKAYLAR